MKLPSLNGVILGANLGLLAVVCFYLFTRTGAPPSIPAPDPVLEHAPAPIVTEKVVKETQFITNNIQWRQLESEDYKDYIARLRSIGCPEQTIRDIIIADLDKLYAPKLKALQGRRQELNYWNSEEEELANDQNALAKRQQEKAIDDEKRKVIEELLGIDLVRERLKQKGHDDYYERRLGFLSEEKRDKVRQVLEAYDDLEQSILNKERENGEPLTPAEKAQLQSLREERQSQLVGVLSSQEMVQMDLWTSLTANSVRHDLYGMNANEEEFQTVYQLRKGFDEKWGQSSELMDAGIRAQYQQAKADLENQIKQRLGEQRYADYQRGSDESFHALSSVATRFSLPTGSATQVYEMKRGLQTVSEDVLNNSRLTPEQKEKALQAIQAETEKQVKYVLGEKAFNYYVWRGQATWLKK
jgi:hypothetical protein